MTLDFMVLGLPRSGTAWLANFLTTDRSLCLHDPFSKALPEHWQFDRRKRGVSCTGAYLLPRFIASQRCPLVVIERDRSACDASLRAMGLPETTDAMQAALDAIQAPRVAFDDLWREDSARALWKRLLPGVAFDALRYRHLRGMNVQTKDWTPDMAVAGEVFQRYGGCGFAEKHQ